MISEIKQRIISKRGWESRRAEEIADKFGWRVGSCAHKTPIYYSGDVVYHPYLGVWRIYSGNTSVTGRNGWTWYVYKYLEIPGEVID